MNSFEGQKRKKAPKRRAASFPRQFLQLLLHVADTGDSLCINTLTPNARSTYTSFRARVNEFRRAFYDEAIAEGNEAKREIGDRIYSVVLREPMQDENNRWYMMAEPKEQGYAQALDSILPEWGDPLSEEDEEVSEDEEVNKQEEKEEESKGRAAINKLYGN